MGADITDLHPAGHQQHSESKGPFIVLPPDLAKQCATQEAHSEPDKEGGTRSHNSVFAVAEEPIYRL